MSPLVPKPPCFDESTNTDCPKRHVGCRSECEEWRKYEEARMPYYKEKMAKRDIETMSPISRRAMVSYYRRVSGFKR